MSDIEALQDAFMKADALAQQGNQQAAQDAKMFADEIRRLKSTGAQAGPEIMPNVNRGIAESLGGIVDLVNPFDKPHALNPFPQGTGSAQTGLANVMEGAGINLAQGAPDGFLEGMARGAGQAAGAVIPGGAVAQGLRGAGGIVGNVADDAARAFSTKAGLASELSAGALAGGAQESAREAGLPDWVQQSLGVAGGIAGASVPYVAARTPTAVLAGQTAKGIKKAVAPYTRSGAGEVARERMQTLAGGEDRARELAGRIDLDNEFGLTPAQQTGDPNMLAIEQAGGRVDPDLGSRLRDRAVESGGRVQQALTDMGGNTQDAQAFIENLRRDVKNRMDALVNWEDATAGASRPRAQRGEAENSQIVADRIRAAEQQALTEEKQLWESVPKGVVLDASGSQSEAQKIIDSVPWAQRNDIPAVLTQYLQMDPRQSVSELHGLYSELRRVARSAMAGTDQNKNRARIANTIADAVLKDMGATDATTEIGRSINRAREFSAQMHETFDRGTVGRLLKRTLDGDEQIDPQETLARSIGQRGVKSKVASEQIDKATTADPDARAAQADYLTEQFDKAAFTPDGAFSRDKALRFMRDRKDVLDRFPGVRTALAESVRAQEKAAGVAERIAARKARLDDPNQSVGAAFIGAPPNKAVDAVATSRDPARAARELVRQARKDKTGKALDGVKAAFADRLVADSLRQIGANKAVVGQTLADRMQSPEMVVALRQVFSPDEMKRLNQIRDAALKLDDARKAAPDIGGVSTATPNKLIEFAVRIAAANHGAQMGKGAAGLQTAQMASGRAKWLLNKLANDRAEQMLLDAIEDPKLFRALLLEPAAIELRKDARSRIAPYITGAIAATQVEQEAE